MCCLNINRSDQERVWSRSLQKWPGFSFWHKANTFICPQINEKECLKDVMNTQNSPLERQSPRVHFMSNSSSKNFMQLLRRIIFLRIKTKWLDFLTFILFDRVLVSSTRSSQPSIYKRRAVHRLPRHHHCSLDVWGRVQRHLLWAAVHDLHGPNKLHQWVTHTQ